MKKVFFKIFSFLFILNFFCVNFFSQELVIVGEGESLYEINLQAYEEFSSLLKKYFVTQQDDLIKTYADKSREIFSIDNAFSEMQSFLVAESLFYWNFYRKNILDEESKSIIDDSIISYWSFLKENIILDNSFFVAYNYVKYFTSLKGLQFELPIEFELEDYNFENNNDYTIPSDYIIRNDFYKTLSVAEGMLFKLNKNKDVIDVQMVLPENTFYDFLNNPKLLYVIFNNEKYVSIKDSFCKTSQLLFDVEITTDENKFDLENIYSFLPEDIFNNIYSILTNSKKDFDVSIQYEFINSFSNFMLKQMKEGFDVLKIFSPLEMKIYNKILENNYFVFCIDLNYLNNLLDKINIYLNLSCPLNLFFSNPRTISSPTSPFSTIKPRSSTMRVSQP
ncbi:MAG: hypothetical protein IIX47_01690 [Spirochaetaceae bacterium]|nr:hypothetical protein [Spirochaetaceae bacterium]